MDYTDYSDKTLFSEEELPHAFEKIQNMDEFKVLEYLYALCPTWIRGRARHYASEYRVLEENWNRLCAQWNVTPREILLVDFLPDPTPEVLGAYQVLNLFCNHLTRMGYVIRKKSELFPCPGCQRLLLTEQVFEFLKQRQSPILPKEWKSACRDCIRQETVAEEA